MKAKFTKERKAQALAAIERHLATVGSRLWNDVFSQFEDIPQASMWKWIREAKAKAPDKPILLHAKEKIEERIGHLRNAREEEAAAAGVTEIAQHVPAGPSPAYIAKTGARGLRNLDVVVEIQRLYADATMLRTYSMKQLENGDEAIKNPLTFEKSIQARARLLDTAIRAVQEIWDLRMQQEFYAAIVEEIGKASPEVQRAIMERLAALNAKRGMTMAMTI